MSWNEQTGVLGHSGGFVEVGFHCSRCEAYAQAEMPLDDYDANATKKDLCYSCDLRVRLASEIRHSRSTYRLALSAIRDLEERLDAALSERDNHEHLIDVGTKIISKQDEIIRELKEQLGNRVKGRNRDNGAARKNQRNSS